MRLKHKYALAFGSLISAALLLNSVVDGYFSYKETVQKVTDIQREKAGFAALGVEKELADLSQDLNYVTAPIKGQSPMEARVQDIRRLASNPAFTSLTLLDAEGRERYFMSLEDASRVDSKKDLSGLEEFKKAISDGAYRGPTYFVHESEPHIKLALNSGSLNAGVLIASVSLEALARSVSETKLGTSGYAYAVDEKGTLVAHKDLNLVLSSAKVAALPQVQRMVPALGGDESAPQLALGRDLQGVTVLTASYPIKKLGWRVFVEQPADEALWPLFKDLLAQWALVLATGISLALAVTTFMVRRLVGPIETLKKSAQEIASGSLNQRIELHSGDEIEELGAQFNQMAEKLSESYADLEGKVALRTSELKVANAQLQEKEVSLELALQKAQQSSKAKTEFLGMMTHELRTPLAGVIGMLDLSLKSASSGETKDRLLVAHQNAHQLLGMLGGLLDIAEMDAGRLSVRKALFNFKQLCQELCGKFDSKAREKNIEFRSRPEDGLPVWIAGDQRLLSTVLGNLLDNAVKFTEHGTITFTAKAKKKSATEALFRFEVVDTGIGIAHSMQESVFSAFEQADISTTKRIGGAGLGLAHAKRLVELMGGEIGFASTEGLGTRFFVEIKLEVVARTPHTRKLRILAAEDININQMIVKSVVKAMGHTIDLVDNGQLALEALASNHYDLVLMDLRMPVMDGIEATRWLRSGSHDGVVFVDPRLPVVALTANTSEEDRLSCLDAGMDGVLSKPLDEMQLHQVISDVIDRHIASGVEQA